MGNGMTYNELKEMCSGDIWVEGNFWRWIICANVNGKVYSFEFEDLTDEEIDILEARMEKDKTDSYELGKADASDIDPTATYGLCFGWKNWSEWFGLE